MTTWIKRQYYAFMAAYQVYRLTLSSFKGGFDPRPMLIDALEASVNDDEWDDGATFTDEEIDALHAAADKAFNTPTMDKLGLRGRSTRH